MAREKKLEAPVTLFAAIEAHQHEGLRVIAFRQRRSIADVVREAIDEFLQKHAGELKAARRAALNPKAAAEISR
jgi:Arc/MetJ-type ribon-helix-helix transcriptional regulator